MVKSDIPHSPLREPMDCRSLLTFYNPWEEIGGPSMMFGASQVFGDIEEDFGGREGLDEEEGDDVPTAGTPSDEDSGNGDDDNDE